MIRFLLALVVAGLLARESAADAPKVYVVLWFDTEDYILPASDDAALQVASWLTKEGVPATFKIVGEKARTLEKRGRQDAIDAMKKHEIGYHSNFHSVQPTPAQYLAPLGWDEGVAEFDRREKPGYDDVKRIFGQSPTCYGQPGSSWGPQSFGAMRKWGMPIYLDAGRHVGLDGKPHFFGGAFTMYQLTHTLRTDLGGENDLKKAEERFVASRAKLLAEGGGIVSTYYHPCEFVHRQFWDGANFTKGANPPREKWQLPAAKTAEESRVAYDTFYAYVRFMKRFADVEFVTATRAMELYRDRAAGHEFTPAQLKALAQTVVEKGEVHFATVEDKVLAPSEILYLLNAYWHGTVSGRSPKMVKLIPTPFGPTGAAPAMPESVATTLSQFERTAGDVDDSIRALGRVPGTIWLGSAGVTPEAYLVALAKLVADGEPAPQKIELKPATLGCAKYVAADDARLWSWVIFPPEFRAPAMMDLAKRQAWTLKPAVLHGPPK